MMAAMRLRTLLVALLCLCFLATTSLGLHSHVGAHDHHGVHTHALLAHAAADDVGDHEHDLYQYADMSSAHLVHHVTHGDGDSGAQPPAPAKADVMLALLLVATFLLLVAVRRVRTPVPHAPSPRAAARFYLLPPSQAPPCRA